jgi:hypothetical protein
MHYQFSWTTSWFEYGLNYIWITHSARIIKIEELHYNEEVTYKNLNIYLSFYWTDSHMFGNFPALSNSYQWLCRTHNWKMWVMTSNGSDSLIISILLGTGCYDWDFYVFAHS